MPPPEALAPAPSALSTTTRSVCRTCSLCRRRGSPPNPCAPRRRCVARKSAGGREAADQKFLRVQSGTGVSVEAVDPVFQMMMTEMLKQTGRNEIVVGWCEQQVAAAVRACL